MHAAIAASEYGSTTLIGEDTDLLVLLLYYMNPDNKSLLVRSDKKSTNQIRVYDISKLKLTCCSFILSQDVTQPFGVGKKSLFQKFVKGDKYIESCALSWRNL